MKTQDVILDRTFDAACLTVKNEKEWSEQIIKRLKANYAHLSEYIDQTYNFYITMVTNNTSFLSRADYLIENKDKVKLRFK